MRQDGRSAGAEANELEFRARTVRVGVRVTLALAAASGVYLALTWSRPDRPLMLVITLLAVLDAALVRRLPHERLIRAGRHDTVLAAWNIAHIAVAAAMAGLDGGPHSPYTAIFFVSVSFAAVSLPRRAVAAIAVTDIFALLLVAAMSDSWPASLLFTAAALTVTATVCASIAGDRWQRNEALQEAKEEMLRRLARVIEYRDNETGEHVERMSAYCAIVARHLGWLPNEAHELRIAATMHDVGKVAVPDVILLKPGALTPQERVAMERHTVAGHEMLAGSRSLIIQQAADIALSHHERWDGGGYPHRVAGSAIPLAARIVAVADVFDALTSDRVYRPALPLETALALLEEGRGTQFDPQVLDAFLAGLTEILAVRTEAVQTKPAGRVLVGAAR